ncbi:hypothetical protein LMG7974_00631 [Campylobacter majalis]|uniref:WG repeat-containing protein n=1 Tax=Campylobacter majalis TaxID=2790656 RepID=A0ABM8Q4Q1_9BACT|nr:WG repeat-containing protein [Campylobacter majalis]CAD7287750.1 hypothetical protein LMG7974_00631 [Campylobacter majalis]
MKIKILTLLLACFAAFASEFEPIKMRDNEFLAKNGDEYVVANQNGDVLYRPVTIRQRKVFTFSEGVALFMTDNYTYGYLDTKGKVIIEPKFSEANSFTEGLAAVQIGGLFGFIDKTGKVIIKPQFNDVGRFYEGLANALKDGKFGFIDKKGKFVIPPKYDNVMPFSEGLAAVSVGEKWGFIDKSGKVVVELKFDGVDEFRDGMTLVRLCEKFGFVDKSGRLAIEAKFDSGDYFGDGLAPVLVDKRWGFIDKSGEFVIEPKFKDAGWFSEGFASVEIQSNEKRVGSPYYKDFISFIDKTGKMIIAPTYEGSIGEFKGGIARVVKVHKNGYHYKGFIKTNGEYLLEPNFRETWAFSEGFGLVEIDDVFLIIDKNGKFVEK